MLASTIIQPKPKHHFKNVLQNWRERSKFQSVAHQVFWPSKIFIGKISVIFVKLHSNLQTQLNFSWFE